MVAGNAIFTIIINYHRFNPKKFGIMEVVTIVILYDNIQALENGREFIVKQTQ